MVGIVLTWHSVISAVINQPVRTGGLAGALRLSQARWTDRGLSHARVHAKFNRKGLT